MKYFILLPRLLKILTKNLPALKEPAWAIAIESGVNILKGAVEAIEKRSNIQYTNKKKNENFLRCATTKRLSARRYEKEWEFAINCSKDKTSRYSRCRIQFWRQLASIYGASRFMDSISYWKLSNDFQYGCLSTFYWLRSCNLVPFLYGIQTSQSLLVKN